MTQRPSRPAPKPRSPKGRPGQDIVVAKEQAAKFPGVGMTLSGYKTSSQKGRRSTQAAGEADSRWQRFKNKLSIKRAILAIIVIILIIGGWYAGRIIYDLHKLFGGNLFSLFSTTKLKGEDSGRVNILLAGNSADDAGHNGGNLTDSIMIVSIDTKNNTAFLLSIPRDLWVHTVSNGWQKINDAYVDGQTNNFSADGYPNGGMGELEQIVSQKFGIPINYYALINYGGIRDAVNAVGGIDITIQSSDPRGLYDPSIDYVTHTGLVNLSNGLHHINGEQALDLARARGDAYGSYGFAQSDFERTQNQRQMLVALKAKIDTASVLTNPSKISSLFDAASNNVKTDFATKEVHRLYDLSKLIPNNKVQSLSLTSANGKNLLMSYQTENGQSALIPALGINNYSAIQTYVNQQISSDPVVKENAAIVLLNGTNTAGLASTVRTRLNGKNYNISQIGDARSSSQVTTSIIDVSNGKKPSTLASLKKQFGSNVTTINPYAGYYTADFIVILGTDQVTSQTTTQQ